MIGIYKIKIVNNEHLYGKGKRLLIFLKGCSIHCDGCIEIVALAIKENVGGITLHGGEPLDQAKSLYNLVKMVKDNKMSVILFTGYKKLELDKIQKKIWDLSDIVISGRFVTSKRNVSLQFRGSSNQRVYVHKGIYKGYRIKDDKTVTLLTLDEKGNLDINGFITGDILKIIGNQGKWEDLLFILNLLRWKIENGRIVVCVLLGEKYERIKRK